MSADNWTVCKACAEGRDQNIRQAIHAIDVELAGEYGNVSLQEFERLSTEAETRRKAVHEDEFPEVCPTFREDYEIYGAEDGVVTVSYSGRCEKCSYGISFETEHPISERAS